MSKSKAGEQDARAGSHFYIRQTPGVPHGVSSLKRSVLVGGRVSAPDLACQSFRPSHRSDAPAFSRSASSLSAAPSYAGRSETIEVIDLFASTVPLSPTLSPPPRSISLIHEVSLSPGGDTRLIPRLCDAS